MSECEHSYISPVSGVRTCGDMYNCCDCGVRGEEHGCGCAYCFSCNACENCIAEEDA